VKRKLLLLVTSGVEVGAGLLLLVAPALGAKLLFGNPLDSPQAVGVARMGGAALLALGVACWLERNRENQETRGLLGGMLVYNSGAVLILGYAALVTKLHGVVLWPGIVLHTGLFAWCIRSLAGDGKQSEGGHP
jgi:hypothetical protein